MNEQVFESIHLFRIRLILELSHCQLQHCLLLYQWLPVACCRGCRGSSREPIVVKARELSSSHNTNHDSPSPHYTQFT
jgi:hypothetical protein